MITINRNRAPSYPSKYNKQIAVISVSNKDVYKKIERERERERERGKEKARESKEEEEEK